MERFTEVSSGELKLSLSNRRFWFKRNVIREAIIYENKHVHPDMYGRWVFTARAWLYNLGKGYNEATKLCMEPPGLTPMEELCAVTVGLKTYYNQSGAEWLLWMREAFDKRHEMKHLKRGRVDCISHCGVAHETLGFCPACPAPLEHHLDEVAENGS